MTNPKRCSAELQYIVSDDIVGCRGLIFPYDNYLILPSLFRDLIFVLVTTCWGSQHHKNVM